MRKAGKNCCKKKERKSGNEEDGCRSRTPRQPGDGGGWVAQDRGRAWEEGSLREIQRGNRHGGGEPREEIVQEALAGLSNYPATVSPDGNARQTDS